MWMTQTKEKVCKKFSKLYVLHMSFFTSLSGTHYQFSFEDITDMIGHTRSFVSMVLSKPHPPSPPTTLPSSSAWLTQLTDAWLVHALNKYSVRNKRVVSIKLSLSSLLLSPSFSLLNSVVCC